jgi:hypothetical protein
MMRSIPQEVVMKNLYRTIDIKSFHFFSFCIALIADGLLFSYIYLKFTQKEIFVKVLNEAWKTQNHQGQPPAHFVTELFQVWNKSLIFMLLLIGGFHLLIYVLWQAKKVSPTKYVKLYFKMGMVGFPLMGIFLLMSDPVWGVLFLMLGLGHYFNMAGMTYYQSSSS